MDTLPLRCDCGKIRAQAQNVTPNRGHHLVCMCGDCQAYAHALGQGERVLDEHGGTEIFQYTPSRIKFLTGTEHIRCLRLSSKGILRWYSGCCRVPLANTMPSPRVPFAGIVHTFFDAELGTAQREQLLGPIRSRIQAKSARKTSTAPGHPTLPVSAIARTLWLMTRGLGLGGASPFFTADSGQPRAPVRLLTPDERETLRAEVRDEQRSTTPAAPLIGP